LSRDSACYPRWHCQCISVGPILSVPLLSKFVNAHGLGALAPGEHTAEWGHRTPSRRAVLQGFTRWVLFVPARSRRNSRPRNLREGPELNPGTSMKRTPSRRAVLQGFTHWGTFRLSPLAREPAALNSRSQHRNLGENPLSCPYLYIQTDEKLTPSRRAVLQGFTHWGTFRLSPLAPCPRSLPP
jgi:hypothetical protein